MNKVLIFFLGLLVGTLTMTVSVIYEDYHPSRKLKAIVCGEASK